MKITEQQLTARLLQVACVMGAAICAGIVFAFLFKTFVVMLPFIIACGIGYACWRGWQWAVKNGGVK